MPNGILRAAGALVFVSVSTAAFSGERPPVVLVSSSNAFDRACVNYYRQGNDTDVLPEIASEFCTCLAAELEGEGLGRDALAFFARTYSEDLTTFIHEYPKGDAWMEASFRADKQCKNNHDYGSNEPPADENAPNPPPGPIEAGSWGGIVRDGPGRNHRKLGSLEQGEHVMLLENTSVMEDGYPWWRIEFRGSREGYQWGGILCSLDEPMGGVYETCR